MTALDQLGTLLGMVVQLAFKRDPDIAGLVGHRLDATDKVDDREPARSESEAGLNMDALVVWPPMRNLARHSWQTVLRKVSPTGEIERANNTTHAKICSNPPPAARRTTLTS